MAPGAWRLFIAHPVPDTTRAALTAQLAPYRQRHVDVRWTRPASWHLTLLFLGPVPVDGVPRLATLTDELARDAGGPYRVRAEHGGGRLRRGEGVAWIGLGEGAGHLIELAGRAAARCPAVATLGAPPKRTPSAHLTIARHADEAVVRDLRDGACGQLGVTWLVDRVALVRSHLAPDGPRYETLHESAL